MANKLIEINGTLYSKHVNTDLTEEQFVELWDKFLEENELLFGGGFCESDDSDE